MKVTEKSDENRKELGIEKGDNFILIIHLVNNLKSIQILISRRQLY